MTVRTDVAALYVDPRGPYPNLVANWYDEERDAKTFLGGCPVVAHPPCGPWSRLSHFSKYQDPTCGPHAVAIVRFNGGVLEHPAHSKLWKHCGLPRPGELPDKWGGRTIEVCQCDWGHVARKRTWIYMVGATVVPPMPAPKEPTHSICNGRGKNLKSGEVRSRATAGEARRTPHAFAKWLIQIAAQAHRSASPASLTS